ncbi:FAD binding domain-containing protein [Haloarcula sediminis]|uniref:FAD binding domain-containing protein n=1 Tax=Haloarcula sediminis TaxID=3111777 RepID=UPI002D795AED|nr:FAD binding domain-containing protein [Haloarcula sp. CK38]
MSHERAEQSPTELDVLISGGSMGGLATGIALADLGHSPTIYERSTGELKSRGGGIVAQQNIRRFLTQHTSVQPESITTSSSERRYLTASGGLERSVSEEMVFTSWDALYRQLRDAVPAERYRMGEEVVGVTTESATAAFEDGRERSADLLIVAEGGQSSTRNQLFPGTAPSFADYVAWRGVIPESSLPSAVRDEFDETFTFYQGTDQLVLAYFIPGPDGSTTPGERRLNWVWYDTVNGDDRRDIFTDTTGTERRVTVPPGRLRDPIRASQRERAAALPPVFETVVAETPELFVQAIYDLSVPEMVVDRVCLLGDSAFVARPHTAAGTAKAVGDAVTLAGALSDHESVDQALTSWNQTRRAYGTRLVSRGKRMGDERLHLGS